MKRQMVVVLAVLASLVGCSKNKPADVLAPTREGIVVIRDAASFSADGASTLVDFENLDPNSSSCPFPGQVVLDNPLTLDGVVFADPACMAAGYCSSPTCQPANIVLSLNQGGSTTLPAGTHGVLFELEGMGDVPYVLEVEDGAGGTILVEETARLFKSQVLGFTSQEGIAAIRVVQVGPTADCAEPPCGPIVLTWLRYVSE